MKKLILAVAAAAPLAMTGANAAASYEKVAKAVKIDAFAKADKRWKRLMILSHSNCGKIGNSDISRLDVIIRAYEPLAKAVTENDAATAMSAGGAFAETVRQNSRYDSCWDAVATRVGLSYSLPNLFQ